MRFQKLARGEVVTPDELAVDPALIDTYARLSRPSLYLVDFLAPGTTTAANRSAFQAAVTAAQAAGKALCADGAYFEMTGAPVTATSAGFVLWATNPDTNKITNSTKGQGVIRVEGPRSTLEGVWLDGANPTVDLSTLTSAERWLDYCAYFAPTAHHGRVNNIKVSGKMYGVIPSTFPIETITSLSDADAANETLYPYLTDFKASGIECENCWTSLHPVSVSGLSMSGIRGNYVAGQVGGADPHLVYVTAGGANDGVTPALGRPNKNVTWGDCHATGGALAPAFKLRSAVGLTITGGITAEGTPGLLDLILCQDFTVGSGCASLDDTSVAQFAVRILHCSRGEIAPLLIKHVGAQTDAAWLAIIDRCSWVRLRRPKIIINPATSSSNRNILAVVGANPGTVIDQPEIINLGSASGAAVFTTEASGVAGSSSQAVIHDPLVVGTFARDVRVALAGTILQYTPTRLAGTTRKIEAMSSIAYTIANLTTPARVDLQNGVIGWHNGENLTSTEQVAAFPSGQRMAYKFGNNWSGDWNGRVLETSSGGRRMATATFPSADADIEVDVLLSTATRAGICLRAVDGDSYLAVSRASGAVKIHKLAAGTATELATAAVTVPNGTWAKLRAVILGNGIYVYLDGILALSHTLTGGDETTYVSAAHGFYGDLAGPAVWQYFTLRSVAA